MKVSTIFHTVLLCVMWAALVSCDDGDYHSCIHEEVMSKLPTPAPTAYVPTSARRTPFDDGLIEEAYDNIIPAAMNQSAPQHRRRLSVGTFGSIRIFLDTSRLVSDPGFMCTAAGQTYTNSLDTSVTGTCSQANVMTSAKRQFLENSVLAATKDYFTRALQVESVQGNLVLPQANDAWCSSADFMCCGKNQPSQAYTTGYPNTDFVLYVTGRPTGGSTIAWALTCATASGSVRPISGHANFGPALINDDLQQQVSTAIHEVSHALGFSSSMFGSFRIPGTTSPRGYSNVIKSFQERGHTVHKIITEEVVAKAKEQFNCPDWGLSAGGEVEDGGAAGTTGSHWEKRVYMNEYMTGTLNANLPAVYSAMTLALFQDSGWYIVDYNVAEQLAWGNGEGCAFAQDYCKTWPTTYFCSQTNRGGCFPNLFFKGKCNFIDNQLIGGGELVPWFRYFPESNYWGGISSVADHCPYFNVDDGDDCRDATNSNIRPLLGESTGVASRCFTGTFARSDAHISLKVYHAGCLRTSCNVNTLAIEVLLKRADHQPTDYLTVTCPKTGTQAQRTLDLAVETSGEFEGTLICPEASKVCSGNPCDTNICSGHGTCQEAKDGECLCDTHFYGDDLFSCDKVRCPPYTDGATECSGHGTCQSDATLAGSGKCACDAGYRGDDCSDRGCPQGPERTVCDNNGNNCESVKLDCDGHGTCNGDTGECTCDAGWLPPNCVLTDCPDHNGETCGGNGTCDDTQGICQCAQTTETDPATGKQVVTSYYSGDNCAVLNNADPYAALYFTGEPAPQAFNVTNIDPNTNQAVPVSINLAAKEYKYFSFNVPSVAYKTEVELTWADSNAEPFLVACYASDCAPLTIQNAQFFATVDKAARKAVIVFVPTDNAPVAAAAYDRLGEMRVAVVSHVATAATVSVTRDACSFLQCVHGTCRNSACDCDDAPVTADGRYGGWSGTLCDAPACPGSPHPCGDFRGNCEVADTSLPLRDQFPECSCNEGFSGTTCSTLSLPALRTKQVANVTTPKMFTGTLDIGESALYEFDVFAGEGVLVELMSMTPDADPILLGQRDNFPSLVQGGTGRAFDEPAWIQHSPNHTLSVAIAADGIYFVRVLNGRYATGPLTYSIYLERHTDCSGGLNNCNGHGVCDKQCKCAPEYEGIRCELVVPTLASGSSVTKTVQIGGWEYFVFRSAASTTEVELQLTGTNLHPKSEPILLVGTSRNRFSNNLRFITSSSALFDYDGFTSASKNQRLVVRDQSPLYYFIGVHNTRNSWQEATVTLTVNEYTTPQYDDTGCDANRTRCDRELCKGRGAYTTNKDNFPVCECESGWAAKTLCGTPQFTSFAMLSAAQEIGFLCNLCEFDLYLGGQAMQVYKIPQPLQASTGLQITASAANASQFGNPSLLVSQYLPRSLMDFRFISSSASPNETLVLRDQSPTGRYWLAVYANTEADYHIQASRQTTPGEKLFSSSFMEELVDWVTDTNIGFITAIVAGALVLCLCLGCCYQICTSGVKASTKQLAENVSRLGADVRLAVQQSSRRLQVHRQAPRQARAGDASMSLALELASIARAAAAHNSPQGGGRPRGIPAQHHIRAPQPTAPRANPQYQQFQGSPQVRSPNPREQLAALAMAQAHQRNPPLRGNPMYGAGSGGGSPARSPAPRGYPPQQQHPPAARGYPPQNQQSPVQHQYPPQQSYPHPSPRGYPPGQRARPPARYPQ